MRYVWPKRCVGSRAALGVNLDAQVRTEKVRGVGGDVGIVEKLTRFRSYRAPAAPRHHSVVEVLTARLAGKRQTHPPNVFFRVFQSGHLVGHVTIAERAPMPSIVHLDTIPADQILGIPRHRPRRGALVERLRAVEFSLDVRQPSRMYNLQASRAEIRRGQSMLVRHVLQMDSEPRCFQSAPVEIDLEHFVVVAVHWQAALGQFRWIAQDCFEETRRRRLVMRLDHRLLESGCSGGANPQIAAPRELLFPLHRQIDQQAQLAQQPRILSVAQFPQNRRPMRGPRLAQQPRILSVAADPLVKIGVVFLDNFRRSAARVFQNPLLAAVVKFNRLLEVGIRSGALEKRRLRAVIVCRHRRTRLRGEQRAECLLQISGNRQSGDSGSQSDCGVQRQIQEAARLNPPGRGRLDNCVPVGARKLLVRLGRGERIVCIRRLRRGGLRRRTARRPLLRLAIP